MDVVIESCRALFVVFLGLSACVGILALTSPRAFAAAVSYSDRAVYQGAQAPSKRRWYGLDNFALAHERLFGTLVVGTVGYLALISHHGPDSYSKSFLLVIVGVALIMGVLALRQITFQAREIATRTAEAYSDPLTGLANRRAFYSELPRRLTQRQRQGTAFCLLIIDVDQFKSFNDEYGHLLGDAILKVVARILESTVDRTSVVARLGGDEFGVLLPDTNLEAASQVAERLRSAIADDPICYEGREHTLTISIGLTEAQLDDDEPSLLKRSDSALYAAKEAGRNRAFRHPAPEPAVANVSS